MAHPLGTVYDTGNRPAALCLAGRCLDTRVGRSWANPDAAARMTAWTAANSFG